MLERKKTETRSSRMCVFCSTIPMVATVGVAVKARQRHQMRRMEEGYSPEELTAGEIEKLAARPNVLPTSVFTRIPVGAITGVVVAGLVTGSVLVHTRGGG